MGSLSSKNRAVFLDRDGTINVEKNYLHKTEDFEFLPNAIEGLKMMQEDGFFLFIISNQSGIARGYYTEDDLKKLHGYMLLKLQEAGIWITDIAYCPHLPDAAVRKYKKDCECRKPKTGMFYQMVEKYQIDLEHSYAIGDKERDLEICRNTGCRGFLIRTGEMQKIDSGLAQCIQEIDNLVDAARMMRQKEI